MWKLSSALYNNNNNWKADVEKCLADKQMLRNLLTSIHLSSPVSKWDVLTQISAHVNIKVDAIIQVFDQVAACDFNERVQVVFFPIRIKDIAGNLEDDRKRATFSS